MTKAALFVFVSAVACFLVAVPDSVYALPIAYPTPPQDVRITTGGGTYDGTSSSIWVRVYSSGSNTWSSWKLIGPLGRNQSATVTFDEGPSFYHITKLQVWVGGDGARVLASVDQHDGGMYGVSPSSTWIKNGSKTLDVFSLSSYSCGQDKFVYRCSCVGYEDCNNLAAKCAEDGIQDLSCEDSNGFGGCTKGSCDAKPPTN